MKITSLCLFCGSKPGVNPDNATLAAGVGTMAAARGITLVYGGGRVVGILPECLVRQEVAQPGLTELMVTATLHERKAAMFDRSDAIVVLPGGIGTMDELFEVMTWKNLGLHAKPILLLGGGSGGFWRPFIDLLGHLDRAGFAYPGLFGLVEPLNDLTALADRLDTDDR